MMFSFGHTYTMLLLLRDVCFLCHAAVKRVITIDTIIANWCMFILFVMPLQQVIKPDAALVSVSKHLYEILLHDTHWWCQIQMGQEYSVIFDRCPAVFKI